MSQPPPASTERRPSTPAKNPRTLAASGEKTIACIPVIMSRIIPAAQTMVSVDGGRDHDRMAVPQTIAAPLPPPGSRAAGVGVRALLAAFQDEFVFLGIGHHHPSSRV